MGNRVVGEGLMRVAPLYSCLGMELSDDKHPFHPWVVSVEHVQGMGAG